MSYDPDAYYEDLHVLPEHDDPENNGETQGPEFGDGDDEPDGDTQCGDNSLDDGEALASAGFGTDEDYGDYGGGDDW